MIARTKPVLFRSVAAGALALAIGALTPGIAAAQQPAAAATTQGEAAKPRLPTVTVVAAARHEIIEDVVLSGTLVPREEILVSPEVDGLAITEILVEEGDRVQKGQVLARLSRVTIETSLAQLDAQIARNQAAIAQARAQIAEADASKVEAARSAERARALISSGTISPQVLDQRVSAESVAEARANAARQALVASQADSASLEAQKRELQIRLARTEIKAPTAGLISRRTARIGAIASMAGNPAFRIIAEGDIELEAEVADSNLARLKPGQVVEITPAGVSQPLAGKVRLISPEVDRATRLGRVRIALPGEARALIGSFASGRVEIGRRTTLSVPISAVGFAVKNPTVQVVNGDTVETRQIKIGLRGSREIEVLSGLNEGDQVVSRAGTFVRDGDKVAPVLADSKRSAQ